MPNGLRVAIPSSGSALWAAWIVHLYTAIGAVLALFAVRAFAAGDPREGFLWLYATVVIDASDGWFARRLVVDRRVPALDGTLLDNIVDYLTFVFAPVSFVNPARTPLLRGWTLTASVVWAALLLVLAWSFDNTLSSLAAWSLIFPLYYVGLSFALHARRDPAVR